MHINEIDPVNISAVGWDITLNKLSTLSPEFASRVTGLADGTTVWDVFFLQDLFQATNLNKSRLIDVGWYPDGDPNGNFRLVVIGKAESHNEFNWDAPLLSYETRSLDQLLNEMRRLMVRV